MTSKLNFARVIFILLTVSLLTTNCKDMKLDIQDLKDRLDTLEGTTITSINEQIVAINTSISDLKEMDAALDGYIKTLEATAADLQKQISEANAEIEKVEFELGEEISALEQSLLNELNTAKEAIEAELTAINATLVELKAAALDKEIEDLQTYVDSQLASTTNWANATFSTLTQYAETQTEIATIKASIEQTNASLAALETRLNGKIADDIKTAIDALPSELNADCVSKIENAVTSVTSAYNSAISSAKEELTTAYKAAIATAIAESEAGMKTWVNEQLTQGYYDIATLDGMLSALSTRLAETDADLLNQINDQKTALQQAMTELTNAYKSAINSAIEENNGIISREIASSIQTLENKINTKLSSIEAMISVLQNKLNAVTADIESIRKQIETLNAKFAALDIEDEELKGMIKNLEDEFNNLLQEYESNRLIDSAAQQAMLNDIAQIYTTIAAILERLDEVTRDFSIKFEDYDVGVIPGSSASVAYTITGATEKTTVKALVQNGWRAQVIQDGTNKGKIKVTAPDPITEDEIIVLVYDGEYRTIMSSVNFVTGVIAPLQTAYEVPAEAGTVDVEITTNYNYSIKIPEVAQTWLTLVNTKSIKTDLLTFSYAANKGNLRQATVVVEDESGTDISQFVIIQKKYIVESSAEAIDLGAVETANCYIVSEEGWYKFNASVKGNSNEKLSGIVSADVVWESFGTAEVPNVGDLIKSVSYKGGYIIFQTADTFTRGNAVIAAKDASGNILWSWHIWLTDQPLGQVYYNNAGTMMDRNLGATSATPGDVGALGLLYQWGRKDPFLGLSSIHYDSNAEAKSTITWPSAVSSDSSTGTIAYATANPTTFIKDNSSNYDWYYTRSSSTDNTRWTTSESNKSIYDPCPSGWRVPDGGSNGVWSKACGSSSSFDYTYNYTNGGMNFSGKFGSASTIWYPASGYRYDGEGSLDNVGYYGYYWSASPNDYGAYELDFDYLDTVLPSGCYGRANGYSVRCLQE